MLTRRTPAVLVLTGVLAAAGLSAVVPAQAASAYPTAPSGVKVTSIGTTSFTVTSTRVANVDRYKVWASTTQADLYAANLGTSISRRTYKSSTSPTIWVSPLTNTSATYYYRYATSKGSNLRYGAIAAVNLKPLTPTGVTVKDPTTAPYLFWYGSNATTFQIQQTRTSAPTSSTVYTIRGTNNRFTPYGLTPGATYTLAVRGLNGSSASPWVQAPAFTARASQEPITLLQYNILGFGFDGTATAGETQADWGVPAINAATGRAESDGPNTRKVAVAATITKAAPDVVTISEGGACKTPAGTRIGVRQVDSLVDVLGPEYALADTEFKPATYCGTTYDTYVIYNQRKLMSVGSGGHWEIGSDSRGSLYASYQLLQSRSSKARFLAVSVHTRAGVSAALDAQRKVEAQSAIDQANRYAAANGDPKIVFGGDVNSLYSKYHPTDGPGQAMRGAGFGDSLYLSRYLSNQQYDSNNRYLRTPPTGQGSIDRIFASPGVAFSTWAEQLNLVNGRFAGTIGSDHNAVLVKLYVPA